MPDKADQEEPQSLIDFIRAEAAKGTPPEETLLLVREMVAKDPSLIEKRLPSSNLVESIDLQTD